MLGHELETEHPGEKALIDPFAGPEHGQAAARLQDHQGGILEPAHAGRPEPGQQVRLADDPLSQWPGHEPALDDHHAGLVAAAPPGR